MSPIAITPELTRLLAEDACAVFWWAFRLRMPREQQIDEVEKALRKRLEEGLPEPTDGFNPHGSGPVPIEVRRADGGADILTKHTDIRG